MANFEAMTRLETCNCKLTKRREQEALLDGLGPPDQGTRQQILGRPNCKKYKATTTFSI